MLNLYKLIEIVACIQSLIISAMLPIYIPIIFINESINNFEISITFQIPTTILLTLIFNRKVVFKAFTMYIILGLFVLPVFQQGGSIGYMLTPNFGYILGIYPLIRIIDQLNKKDKIKIKNFLLNGLLAICAMHLTGIIYNFIQLMFYSQLNIFFYNIGKYSISKIGYHLMTLIPLILLIKPIKYIKYKK